MRIEQITLNNYRQYHGKVIVKFPTTENAFSIVVGANGAGKSNLWNAIHWCLFNDEPHFKSKDKPPIINKHYLNENIGCYLTTYVEIIMVKGNDKYLIKRSLSGSLEHLDTDDNGMIKLSNEDPVPAGFFIQDGDKSEVFQISINGGVWENKIKHNNFGNLVHEHIIPENLAMFFILDGEFLQDLFIKLQNVKSGIDQISQINILNKTIEYVSNVKFQMPSGIGEMDKIQENIDEYTRLLESENKLGITLTSKTQTVFGTDDPMHQKGIPRRNDLEISIKNIEQQMLYLNKKIDASNAIQMLEIRERYTKTLQKIKHTKEELEVIIQRHINSVIAYGPRIMCKSSLKFATDSIKEEMDRGNLPNAHKRMMLGDLLAKNICLCGTTLEEGTNTRNYVEQEMNRIVGEVKYDIASDMRYNNEHFLNDYDDIMKRLDEEQIVIKSKKDEYDTLSEELKDLKRKLPNEDYDYAELIAERDKLDIQCNEYREELGGVKNQIDGWEKDRGNEIRKLDNIKEKTKEKQQSKLLMQTHELIRNTLSMIKQDVDETIRNKVANKTLEIYNNMTWKDNYEFLQIDDKYNISIRSKGGIPIEGGDGMAAGEKLFLALSFIMALKNITNYRFPFVIDSPLGKAGGNLKISFGKYLPKLLDGSQMIMFATNTEYNNNKLQPESGGSATHTLKELLEQNGTVHEYEINFDKDVETATIINKKRS